MEIPAVRNVRESHHISRSSRKIQDHVTIVMFLAPAFILFIAFLVYPILRSVYFSTFDWNGLGPAVDYVGLDNFQGYPQRHGLHEGSVELPPDCRALFGHTAAGRPGAGDHGGT